MYDVDTLTEGKRKETKTGKVVKKLKICSAIISLNFFQNPTMVVVSILMPYHHLQIKSTLTEFFVHT